MTIVTKIKHSLQDHDLQRLERLRATRRTREDTSHPEFTPGDRIADWVAATMGSWTFIIIQSIILLIWIILNVTAYVRSRIRIPSSCSTSFCRSKRLTRRPSS